MRPLLCLGERGDKMSMRKQRTYWHQTKSQSQINPWLNYLIICQQYDCFQSASTENRQLFNQRIYRKIDSANKCEKEATFPHTSHQEQNKHDTIESDLLNLSHPHQWPLLWLMRSVDHECLRFCSAWLMVTFGCQGAPSKSVPHTQWPAAGALTMAGTHSGHTHF